jgi:hypothetical protein
MQSELMLNTGPPFANACIFILSSACQNRGLLPSEEWMPPGLPAAWQ